MKKKMLLAAVFVVGILLLFFYGKSLWEQEQKGQKEEIQVFLENVWIRKGEGDVVTIFSEGEERSFPTIGTLSETITDEIGDLRLVDGVVTEIVIKSDLTSIRVLIGNEDYRGVYHDCVEITSDGSFVVDYGEAERHFAAGEVFTTSKADFATLPGQRIIRTEESGAKLTLLHLTRADGHPSYRGSMELAYDECGLYLVNELPLEEYLYAVLPSEMPSSYGSEALKAQAICARTYAANALSSSRFTKYGAQVDDSVACQVYNNRQECEASICAVKETYGKILEYEGNPAQSYFFSTSCGTTAAATEVWNTEKDIPYLQGGFHGINSTESFDSEAEWYRWSTFLPIELLESRLRQVLCERYERVPELILTLEEDSGAFVSRPITEPGELLQLQVWSRGESGIATELLVVGSEHTYLIKKEYNIRCVLATEGETIFRENAGDALATSLLPSAFVSLKRGKYNGADGYLIEGGGFGHGVGMSQCGARAMAACGYTAEEILNEYFPGTYLGLLYR